MKTILEIRDSDIFPNTTNADPSGFKERQAVRAVVTNEVGQVALLYSTRDDYHKLPGGGVESGEDLETALKREILEEVGARVLILAEIGKVVEYKNRHRKKQTSYVYLATKAGQMIDPTPTERELAAGFEPKWVDSLEIAMASLERDTPTADYVAHFIRHRDLALLQAAKQLYETVLEG